MNQHGEITDVVERFKDPPSNLAMTGFYTFTPAVVHACHLVQPSNRDEYEISDTIDLLVQSGRDDRRDPPTRVARRCQVPRGREGAKARLLGEFKQDEVAETADGD
jgi:glucose-1-phosphate thymidylyltransferase